MLPPAAGHFFFLSAMTELEAKLLRAEIQAPDLIIVFELKDLLSPLLKQGFAR